MLLKRKLSLFVKFNVMFVVLFGITWVLMAYLGHQVLVDNAERQVKSQAQLIMDWASAIRQYTVNEVKPIQDGGNNGDTFLLQAVPAHAATAAFRYLREKYPAYSYQEPALNPTNLIDQATDWEKIVISKFQADPDKTTDTGEVPENETGEPALYIARPLKAEGSCLHCHSNPSDAPGSMKARYGTRYGYKWKENDIVAAQVVIVPKRVQSEQAQKDFARLVGYLAFMFVTIIAIVDAALVFVVIRPIKALLSRTDLISKGQVVKEHLTVRGEDEIADLSRCFNRLQDTIAAFAKLAEHV